MIDWRLDDVRQFVGFVVLTGWPVIPLIWALNRVDPWNQERGNE